MPDVVDVLVVGAGPVGLATACALRLHGVHCRVVDRLEGPTPLNESRALALWARTLEVLEDLGCVRHVLEKGIQMHALNAYHNRKRLARVEFDLKDAETPFPYVLVLPQGYTERILIERLAELGTVVERSMRVTALEQEHETVTATVVDPHGSETKIEARWLVGCDGAHSAVRHALDFGFEGNAYPETFRLVDATINWNLNHAEAHMVLLSGGGGMAVFPLPGENQWRLVDVSNVSVGDEPGAVLERFQSLLDRDAPASATLGEVKWVSSFRIQRRIANHFRLGRCFVAGDAAHIHSPAGGQGMNTGIQDGHNLAWKLAMVLAGTAPESLLDSYEIERRPVAQGVLEETDLLTRAVLMQSKVGRWVRNAVVPIVTSIPWATKRLALKQSELEIDYGKSPIVKEDEGINPATLPDGAESQGDTVSKFRKGPRAGRRCPEVVVGPQADGTERRLFDFLDVTKHTLLVFAADLDVINLGTESAKILDAAQKDYNSWIAAYLVIASGNAGQGKSGPQQTILDSKMNLHTRFGATSGTIYLIRPDGYVAYRRATADLKAFTDYLQGHFEHAKHS